MVKHLDLVCGCEVVKGSGIRFFYDGKIYYFCSQKCRKQFIEENQITLSSQVVLEDPHYEIGSRQTKKQLAKTRSFDSFC